MLVLPAIDLLDGRPVRLQQGRYDEVSWRGQDARGLAAAYASAGAPWLHVIDLDGARAGSWRHLSLIAEIARSVSVPVQAGGGARTMVDVDAALEAGVARVIVGTAAIESPTAFAPWTKRYGDRLAVSLDARGEQVAVRGWTASASASLDSLAEALREAGARRFIHTAVQRDGTMLGVDLSGFERLQRLGLPVLVAGGVASYEVIARLRAAGAEGGIFGRALLSGAIDLGQALRRAAPPDQPAAG